MPTTSNRLSPIDFLNKSLNTPMIDVRSPGEFRHGHIPGSINIPLLNDEERAIVGTLYKQEGQNPAILKGLELIGPKMASFVKMAQEYADPTLKAPLLVYCWRGGQRSRSMAWLLSLVGFQTYTLHGGYKAFRRLALNHFEKAQTLYPQLIILGGMTGSGKTAILKEILNQKLAQVIDLEALAHHKGSAFGALGEATQPTTEHFENKLFMQLRSMDGNKPLWVEDESLQIGSCSIPKTFFEQMRKSPVIKIEVDHEQRLDHLVSDYASYDSALIENCLLRIEKRLGGQHVKAGREALAQKDFRKVAEIALNYYDKAYTFGLSKRESTAVFTLPLDRCSRLEQAKTLLQWTQSQGDLLWKHNQSN